VVDVRAAQQRELVEIARSRRLRYPIKTKAEFIAQMRRAADTVVFRDRVYDAVLATELIPEFFFPVESERDLVEKTMELLLARGLLPFATAPLGGGRRTRRREAAD
jgi:hypothetical protein